jgi:DNA-directed RNA polymerase specialized sigma54-like protein
MKKQTTPQNIVDGSSLVELVTTLSGSSLVDVEKFASVHGYIQQLEAMGCFGLAQVLRDCLESQIKNESNEVA